MQHAILVWHIDHIATVEAGAVPLSTAVRHRIYSRAALVRPGVATHVWTGEQVLAEGLYRRDDGQQLALIGWSSCPRRPLGYPLTDLLWAEVRAGGVHLHPLCDDRCKDGDSMKADVSLMQVYAVAQPLARGEVPQAAGGMLSNPRDWRAALASAGYPSAYADAAEAYLVAEVEAMLADGERGRQRAACWVPSLRWVRWPEAVAADVPGLLVLAEELTRAWESGQGKRRAA